jgi:hypothetical protein
MSTESLQELTTELAAIDAMVASKAITLEKANEWKSHRIAIFELEEKLADPPREKVDLAHLPGRMVGAGIKLMGAIVRGSGATYEGLSKQEGYMNSDGTFKKTRARSPDEMMRDLDNRYR